MEDIQPRTFGSLVQALVQAKTLGRDFHLSMIEAFNYLPAVADVWRSLLVEECMQLHRLREIEEELIPAIADQPVEPETLRRARAVPAILSEDRIGSIRTLDDACRLLSEYESSALHGLVGKIAAELSPNERHLQEDVHGPADSESRISSILERFGDPNLFPMILVTRGGVLPCARWLRPCAA